MSKRLVIIFLMSVTIGVLFFTAQFLNIEPVVEPNAVYPSIKGFIVLSIIMAVISFIILHFRLWISFTGFAFGLFLGFYSLFNVVAHGSFRDLGLAVMSLMFVFVGLVVGLVIEIIYRIIKAFIHYSNKF